MCLMNLRESAVNVLLRFTDTEKLKQTSSRYHMCGCDDNGGAGAGRFFGPGVDNGRIKGSPRAMAPSRNTQSSSSAVKSEPAAGAAPPGLY
ncbi:hypothetical protein KUCAC02_018789, partial [Chaenocephalus aceratus]